MNVLNTTELLTFKRLISCEFHLSLKKKVSIEIKKLIQY